MSLEKNYIIIGNGIAGMTAAEEIRKSDKNSKIKIFSEESYLTYYRIKLSHSISQDVKPQDLLIHNEDWYKERNIEVFLNRKVKAIDPDNSRIFLENGEGVSYDKLLLANGSQPSIPPIEGINQEGVYALRTVQDLQNLQGYLKDCKEVAVIGGGLLGLEAAWSLKERGLKVHVLEFFPYLLPRQLDKELAIYVKERLETQGLNIHVSAATKEILGSDKVVGVQLGDGRKIPADMVLLSTGVKANIDILKDSGIDTNRGVIVDANMKTTVDNIYAAGDIVEYNGVLLALWSDAVQQGKIAAKNMLGIREDYGLPEPATLLSIGGFSAFSVGEIKDTEENISYKEGDIFHKLFIENGKLIGGVLTGNVKKMAVLKKAVNENLDISSLLNKNMHIPDILDNI